MDPITFLAIGVIVIIIVFASLGTGEAPLPLDLEAQARSKAELEEQQKIAYLQSPEGELALALAEIDADPKLSLQQRLSRKAKTAREWRILHGKPDTIRGISNQTGIGRTFAQAAARSAGRALIRGLFKSGR